MSCPRLVTACLAICFLLPFAGCGSTKYVAVELEVRDAQTHEPIRDVRISLHWEGELGLFTTRLPPTGSEWHWGKFDEESRVSFPVIAEGVWLFEVDAPGYDLQSDRRGLRQPEEDEDKWWGGWVSFQIDRRHPFDVDRRLEYRIVSLVPAEIKRSGVRGR